MACENDLRPKMFLTKRAAAAAAAAATEQEQEEERISAVAAKCLTSEPPKTTPSDTGSRHRHLQCCIHRRRQHPVQIASSLRSLGVRMHRFRVSGVWIAQVRIWQFRGLEFERSGTGSPQASPYLVTHHKHHQHHLLLLLV